jgi:hypothetical protein
MTHNMNRRGFAGRLAAGVAALAGGAPLAGAGLARAAGLRAQDEVHVFPTLARQLADGSLVARIDAWVHEPETRAGASEALATALQLDLAGLSEVERALFEQRARLFKQDSHRGRLLMAWLGGAADSGSEAAAQALPPSDALGRVRAQLRWPAGQLPPGLAEPAAGAARSAVQRVALSVAGQPDPAARRFAGQAWLLPAQGLSVVSDIDDTIKHTQVRQLREMLLNTFARPFAAVPGMAAWYQGLERAQAGVAFHYVSGGPQHMGAALQAWLGEAGFPAGSLHLRAFSIKPHRLLEPGATKRHKLEAMEEIVQDHPQRRLLLVGDSGERDPETYGELARRHPQRVAGVLIRDVTGQAVDDERYAKAFAGVARERWRLFTEPAALPLAWPG